MEVKVIGINGYIITCQIDGNIVDTPGADDIYDRNQHS